LKNVDRRIERNGKIYQWITNIERSGDHVPIGDWPEEWHYLKRKEGGEDIEIVDQAYDNEDQPIDGCCATYLPLRNQPKNRGC
jgi:hypothetical protein